MHTYIPSLSESPPHPVPPIQVTIEHQAEQLSVLHHRFPLALYFTYSSVFMSNPVLQFLPPSPALCPHVRSVCISIPALELGSSVPFF